MHSGGAAGLYRNTATCILLALWASLWIRDVSGQAPENTDAGAGTSDRKVFVLDVDGPIGPATRDYLTRSLDIAAERGAALVVIRMDTPGGLDASTRDIIKAILNSRVPVATYVAPGGARAASAGTYILYASHVAAMSPATNVGAATPVAIIGGTPGAGKETPKRPKPDGASEDDEGETPGDGSQQGGESESDAMSRKVVNDAVAYIRGLAEKRGRNADWAERAVRQAESITSEKALELGVIDFIANSVDDLLEKADGMVVEVDQRNVELETAGAEVETLQPDWRSELLGVITSPTIAYLLLLIGVYGLILEGYNPGAVLPGVVGAICLLMALYAFQMLPVNYAGLGLIVLGVILLIAEVMAPSFGALGFGGIISIVIGSIILVDTDVPGFGVSRPLIGSIALIGSLGLLAIIWVAVSARNRPVVSGREELVGAYGEALEDFEGEGHVYVHSERWNAVSDTPIRAEQAVVVTGLDGLTLKVRPAGKATQEQQDV